MSAVTVSALAATCFIVASACLWPFLRNYAGENKNLVAGPHWLSNGAAARIFALIGCICLTFALIMQLPHAQGLALDLPRVAGLISLVTCALLLISSLFREVLALALLLFPICAIASICMAIAGDSEISVHGPAGLQLHIVSSILAYALFAIAALQAVMLWLQERNLRHHRPAKLLKALPPITAMESWMFQLLTLGFVTLTLSLASSIVFVSNIAEQHLIHKMVLSIAAWLTFGTLLFGHWRRGWRGRRAVRWTLTGTLLLGLAYLGSKIVLESVLNQRWG